MNNSFSERCLGRGQGSWSGVWKITSYETSKTWTVDKGWDVPASQLHTAPGPHQDNIEDQFRKLG